MSVRVPVCATLRANQRRARRSTRGGRVPSGKGRMRTEQCEQREREREEKGRQKRAGTQASGSRGRAHVSSCDACAALQWRISRRTRYRTRVEGEGGAAERRSERETEVESGAVTEGVTCFITFHELWCTWPCEETRGPHSVRQDHVRTLLE